MSNPPWPSTLPDPLYDGGTNGTAPAYVPQPNVLRTSVDAGVAKVRRRFTSVASDFGCTVVLTASQLADLEAFYWTTLAQVGLFDWTDFRTTGAGTYRFKTAPVAQPIPVGRFAVALDLELMP